MAFVVILHLSPDHKSNVAHILQQETAMPVQQVVAEVKVLPNSVYIIPPNKHLALSDGMLLIQDRGSEGTRRAPIDIFFRALADTHGRHAVAVVLTGNGADGTIGLRRIKESGGVAFVQDPQEAEYDSMPRSAIATGLVDFVLPVNDIPLNLVTYWRNAQTIQLPSVDALHREDEATLLREIFTLLRSRTGHDFSQYKRPTLMRHRPPGCPDQAFGPG